MCGKKHSFRLWLKCEKCGKEKEIIVRNRPCKAPHNEAIEKRRVGCRECHKPHERGFLMYFLCGAGRQDHDSFIWNDNHIYIHVDNLDTP